MRRRAIRGATEGARPPGAWGRWPGSGWADKWSRRGGPATEGMGERRRRRQTGGVAGPRDVAAWARVTCMVAATEGAGAWRRRHRRLPRRAESRRVPGASRRRRREPSRVTCGGNGPKRSREAAKGDGRVNAQARWIPRHRVALKLTGWVHIKGVVVVVRQTHHN
ncbi:hypothetical protein GUJ93_ZPchr0009g1601 [Zizania palustris]|uniref:Uncharacterized protein n=1 Tax=Zizania palustris TaxID=103762 RepID=A0A8J5V8D4_ZIZPA|nr:hypothetical protein GUJ93_ZPchr0009g1601 [Zizania palustris]